MAAVAQFDHEHAFQEALDLHKAGRLEEAQALYREIVAALPDHFDALHMLGVIDQQRGDSVSALARIDAALKLKPQSAEAHNNRGVVLKAGGRFEEALASYERALALNPNYGDALNNRGSVLAELQRPGESLASIENAIALKPSSAEAFYNRGSALLELNRREEALTSFGNAIALKPDYADAFKGRATALSELKRLDEALASYESALALAPDFSEARYGGAIVKLLKGDYREGWQGYEARPTARHWPSDQPAVAAPYWSGEDVRGKRMLVFFEQGLGDIIQFARYVPLLAARGAKVTFLLPPKMIRLLKVLERLRQGANPVPSQKPKLLAGVPLLDKGTARRGGGGSQGSVSVVAALPMGGGFDLQCALLSLPLHFGTELHTIPHGVPYLKAERERVERWSKRIGRGGYKIGIAWQGRADVKFDRGRSPALSEFIPLARVPGVRLISLQKNDGVEQLARLPAGVSVETLGEEFDGGDDALVDTAAAMESLDLIVSSDTSIAHLAGALARPCWVALKYVPDWRWLLEREDSPWYPTLSLVRQDRPDDWKSVFSRMEHELKSRLGGVEPAQTAGRVEEKLQDATAGSVVFENAYLRVKRCKHGTMMYFANDDYIGRSFDLYGEFSEGETALFNQILKPGMTVIDAGANIGAHTVYFANAVGARGRVFAFEPQRVLHQILCGNVALNMHANVVTVQAALGAAPGRIVVPRIDYAKGGNFGGVALAPTESGETVNLHTLDAYGLKSCHFIKIDVEGMEQAVLEGARKTLATHQPMLYIENDREDKSPALIQWLFENGYRLYWHLPYLFNPNNHFGEQNNVFGDLLSINMLAVPKSKDIEVKQLREVLSPAADWRDALTPLSSQGPQR